MCDTLHACINDTSLFTVYPRTSPPNNTGRELIPLPTQHQGAYFCVQLTKRGAHVPRKSIPLANFHIGGACTISGSLIPSGVRLLHVPLSFRGRSSCPGVGVPVLGWKFRGEAISLGRCLPRSFYPGGVRVL